MKCPVRRCVDFYIKDSQDELETNEFELKDGQVAFSSKDNAVVALEIQQQTEAFCNKCSWHGKRRELA